MPSIENLLRDELMHVTDTVQPGQLGTAASRSIGATARRRVKSAARQSRNREYSMAGISAHSYDTFRLLGGRTTVLRPPRSWAPPGLPLTRSG